MIKSPISTTLSKKKRKRNTKKQPKRISQTTINLKKSYNNNYPLFPIITSHLPCINSNEKFPPLNKTINNNFSDNISDESNSDGDSLPELSKRKQELDQESEDEDSYEEIETIIRSRKGSKTYSQRNDQETKTKTLKIPSTKIPNPNNKGKRDKQQSTSKNKSKKSSQYQRVGINKPLHKVFKCRQGKQNTNNKSLHDFGFKFKSKTKVINTNNKSLQYSQDYLPNKLNLPNEPKGNPMITKPSSSIRIFYMNINGIDQTTYEYSFLQLCSSLKTKDVDVICLTKTNIDWNKPHLVN